MTQGIFVDFKRPRSKKEVKEAIKDDAGRVRLEATSIFGNEYDGSLDGAPDGDYYFVCPSPQDRRSFGHITIKGDNIKIE